MPTEQQARADDWIKNRQIWQKVAKICHKVAKKTPEYLHQNQFENPKHL
jgi:hypothetical protein